LGGGLKPPKSMPGYVLYCISQNRNTIRYQKITTIHGFLVNRALVGIR